MRTAEETFELWDPPAYERGDEVISQRDVRNDGTFPGAKMGEVLIKKGDVGYVHSVGTYLNRFYVYGVEFVDAGRLVGMRAHELQGKAS
jgi:nitrogen fixation protein NifZ